MPSVPANATTGTLSVSAVVAPLTKMPPLVTVSVVPMAPPTVRPDPFIASALSVLDAVSVVEMPKLLLVIRSVSVARAALMSLVVLWL